MININMTTAPTGPAFAILENNISWQTCRERFANSFRIDKMTSFYFAHVLKEKDKNIITIPHVNVVKFISKVEEVLEIENTKFFSTNIHYVQLVEPSKFWLSCEIRMSLLTILLYASLSYDSQKDNFDEALFGHDYIKRTAMAVKRFLFGYTKFVKINSKRNWWVETFESNNLTDVKRQLVLENKHIDSFIGKDNLWSA